MLRKILMGLYLVCLAFFTTEIAVRRFVFKQVPLDVPLWIVLLILALNGWVLVTLARRVAQTAPLTKTEKS